MAALHTLHRARQWLRVLACDGTGRSTAVIAPLALIPILPEIPLLTALRCTDEEMSEVSATIQTQAVVCDLRRQDRTNGPGQMVGRPAVLMASGEVTVTSGN